MTYDYQQIANDIAGPDCREAVRVVAEKLHYNESMHLHEGSERKEPCSYCWLRAGKAVRALREFNGHPSVTDIVGGPVVAEPIVEVDPWPLRVRLANGRKIHAARVKEDSPIRETPCGYFLSPQQRAHWQPTETPVSCSPCLSHIRKEEGGHG